MKARILTFVALMALLTAACSDASGESTSSTTSSGAPSSTSSTPPSNGDTPPPSDPSPTDYRAEFVADDCDFEQPMDTSPRCGYLVVPEDRNDPAGRQVRIHLAIFEATGPDPKPDPIIYLEGGPGGHTLGALEFSFASSYAPLITDRDLILFDQRGIGRSLPALDCPEERAVEIEYLNRDVSDEEYLEAYTGGLIACRDRLVDDGVDLTAYNSASNAADVADIRRALGYDEVNLWGISYGTRLALTVMRDHPEGIRSVVLDSTVPVDLDLYPAIPSSADRAYDVFFAGCAADPSCGGAFPSLEADFYAVADRLEDDPVEITVQDFISGDRYPALFGRDDVFGLVFQSLYSEEIIPLLPDFITDAANGDYSGLERLASVFFTNGPFLSTGFYLSVQCNEEYSFSSADEVAAAVEMYPDVDGLFGPAEAEFEECSLWGAGTADPIEDEPVVSSIPTLVLAGTYDPITPPSYGQKAAETLSNSTFFEFPGYAHGVTTAGDCPTGIVLDFVADPTASPDGSCIADLGSPNFLVPGQISVTLVPFEADVFGFIVRGVRPESWSDGGLGVFTAPGLGDVGILQQSIPSGFLTTDAMADQIASQFDLTGEWDTRTHNDGSRTWDINTAGDGTLIFDLALHDDGEDLFLVVLITTDDVREEYLGKVLYPALEVIEAG